MIGEAGFVIGVDGGGTSTDCAVLSLDGTVLAQSSAGPSNPRRVGLDGSVATVRQAVTSACSAAKRAPPADWACYCIAGAGAPDFREKIRPLLEALGLARAVTVDHDARAALVGAHGFAPGVVAIAGTGAVVFAQDRSGNEVQVDGWGPLLGDEGSGYWIGQQTLLAVARAFDRRGPQTALTDAVLAHLGISSPRELLQVLPLDRTNSEMVSGLARVCLAVSRKEDLVAQRIVQQAIAHLATSVLAAVDALDSDERVRVAFMGGVAGTAEVAEALRREVAAEHPRVTFVDPLMPPSVGAALLALRAVGVTVDGALIARARRSAVVCRRPCRSGAPGS